MVAALIAGGVFLVLLGSMWFIMGAEAVIHREKYASTPFVFGTIAWALGVWQLVAAG